MAVDVSPEIFVKISMLDPRTIVLFVHKTLIRTKKYVAHSNCGIYQVQKYKVGVILSRKMIAIFVTLGTSLG